MVSSRETKRDWERSPRSVGAVAGSLTAVLGYLLCTVFLLLTTNEPIGTTFPFTWLTGGNAVSPPIAVVWTLLDAHWVYPSVVVGNGRIYIDTLENLANRGEALPILLRAIPPVLLVGAGASTATYLRRNTPKEYGLYGGAVIAVGYTPFLLIPGLLARVPVAPDATGKAEVGNTVFEASELVGVSASPGILFTIFVSVYYPTVFGAVGAWLSTVPQRLTR